MLVALALASLALVCHGRHARFGQAVKAVRVGTRHECEFDPFY